MAQRPMSAALPNPLARADIWNRRPSMGKIGIPGASALCCVLCLTRGVYPGVMLLVSTGLRSIRRSSDAKRH